MTSAIWSIAILVIAIAGIFGFRNLSNRARFAFDLVCLVALSAVLYERGGTSLFESPVAAPGASTIWLRAEIVAWWILSARIVVGLLVLVFIVLQNLVSSASGRLTKGQPG